MTVNAARATASGRIAIIGAVTTYLGFFVLLLLVVEVVVGAIALKGQSETQLVALYGFLLFVFIITAMVGFFAYFSPDALLSSTTRSMRDFSRRISGTWLQMLSPDEPAALSLVTIYSDPSTGIVRMGGETFAIDGRPTARWETKATCADISASKVFYYWKGWFKAQANEEWEGHGEMSFDQSTKQIQRGTGMFSDMNLTAMGPIARKLIVLQRCTEQEAAIIRGGDSKARARLIQKKCGRLPDADS